MTHDPTLPDDDLEDDVPSADFARALESFERGANENAGLDAPVPATVSRTLAVGDAVSGRVVAIGDTHALIDHGGRSEATADLRHFRLEDGSLRIGVGDVLDLFVVDAGDQVALAPVAGRERSGALQSLREAQAAGMPVSGRVTGVNSGGLEVELGGVRGFCPISQVDVTFVADASVHVGRTLEFLVTKVGEAKGGTVVSRRQLLQREQRDRGRRTLASLSPGTVLDGRVARLEPFGAFVDVGGIDGMVHVSEVAHERLAHPNERLTEGQAVRVQVLSVEPEGPAGRPRISLSIKATLPDPWISAGERFAPGMRVRGKVSRLADFGAFVNLAPGVDGLVHVSEAAAGRVRHVKDVLAPGDEVDVVVLSVDPAKKRIGLSVRQAMGAEAREPEKPAAPESRGGTPPPKSPEEPTTMAIALRKAMAKAREKSERQETENPRP